MIFTLTFLTSCVKLLLIPAYHSTDFEVHRNWLAITHSLPMKKWYFEETSEWTLDYPPLFAHFEYILSFVARFFDEKMLLLDNLNYESNKTVIFLRLSVIITDLVYAVGAYLCCKSLPKTWKTDVVLPILLITNCGLIMVDHIHFQYNGILYGLLLISLSYAFQGKFLISAFWFSVLLNMKHIYIYLAPAYFIFFLKHHCLAPKDSLGRLKNLTTLGTIVISVFGMTFLPFRDHLGQVLARMFPFKRGLCHAYWAPNFWAIYNTVDKSLDVLLNKIGYSNKTIVASMTGGLVQEFSHQVLPNITPICTILLTAVVMLPALVKLWYLDKNPVNFLRCLVLCALSSFLFGWHVHEKAILMVIIPLSVLSILDIGDAKTFLLLSVVGHYSLFPLLFPNSLVVVKVLLLLVFSIYSFHSLYKVYPFTIQSYTFPLLKTVETLYILGLGVLFFYENLVHYFIFKERLPFLPLLLTSLYCSIGILYCWLLFYFNFLTRTAVVLKKNKKVR